ncbi:unnamed protein product [Tuber aestivum]|uniref:Extracellular membrane protein CFEM domain-containing protein n=1 Tax=Tuber aestivum TaxID=59557 RepID=A0A292Q1C3_9PEZI|nr:unnamed protein product [Tuber aestivum]
MRFQSLATFSSLFVLTLVSQSQGADFESPTCSELAGALIEDCREALTHVDTTWPRPCVGIYMSFVAAQVRTCLITTFDPKAANCLPGNKVIAAAQIIMSTCTQGEGSQVGGTVAFSGTNGRTRVRIGAAL